MTYWLTSHNKKRHQRAINKLVRAMNRNLEQDELWRGRFVVRQDESPQWRLYEDGSGAELFVRLRFIDRATGRYYVKWESVNHWRGLRATGYEIWKMMNWLILSIGIYGKKTSRESKIMMPGVSTIKLQGGHKYVKPF